MTITNNPAASGSAFTLDMGKDSVTGNQVQKVALTEPSGGTFITPMQQTGGSITSLSSGAITNPTSTLTRPASAVSASVTATNASPCVFTWTGNPLINGQTAYLLGTAVPAGFTAGVTYFVVGVSGNNFSLSTSSGGVALNSTSTGTLVTANQTYAPNQLIGSAAAAGSVVVPSFAIATAAGGVILPRVRLRTNGLGGWNGASLSINLWSVAPTYTNGDGQQYAVATGGASWLANIMVSPMTQFDDGAIGAGQVTGVNEMAFKLATGTSVFWDMQALSYVAPGAGQTFTITPELLN